MVDDLQAYRAAHEGLDVRVYFLMYKDSVEEQRYLSGIRKEKDAFERLIRERGVSSLPNSPPLAASLLTPRCSPTRAEHGDCA